MKIECTQWTPRGTDHGTCALNLYGGKPSFGTCAICPKYDGANRPKIEAPKPVDLSCTHRGPELTREPCSTCTGTVLVAVFACPIWQRCSIDKTPDGVRSCRSCADRKANNQG